MKLVDKRLVGNKNCKSENLVLFFLSCKKDIYSFNTSPQVEKEKKKGMVDINLRRKGWWTLI